MRFLSLFGGRREAEAIQQPAPVFFSPEEERRMTVGYKYKPAEATQDDEDGPAHAREAGEMDA